MKLVVVLLGVLIFALFGCGSDEEGEEDALRCPSEPCVDCEGDEDCDPGLRCHDEGSVCVTISCEGHGDCPAGSFCGEEEVCVEQVCQPGESRCEGASVS